MSGEADWRRIAQTLSLVVEGHGAPRSGLCRIYESISFLKAEGLPSDLAEELRTIHRKMGGTGASSSQAQQIAARMTENEASEVVAKIACLCKDLISRQ